MTHPRSSQSDADTVPAVPEEFGFSRYSLRLWHGMAFGAWMRLLRGNWGKISPSRYGLLVSATVFSLGNSILKGAAFVLYGRRLTRVQIDPHPVFILGHWRSGTTWLHQILAADPRFAAPTALQCFCPEGFLAARALIALIMRFSLPRNRPMDNVGVNVASKEEDEFALLLGGAVTPYRQLAFPCDATSGQGILPETLSTAEADFWRKTWLGFLRRVQFVNPGKRLLLKSPAHTVRLREILRHFPDARFIHIVRDPYSVFLSCEKSSRAMAATQALQDRTPAPHVYRESTLQTFSDFDQGFEAMRSAVPEGHMVTVRYEDLRADPQAVLRGVYTALDLGDFAEAEARLAGQLEASKGYKTNVYEMPPGVVDQIDSRWRDYFVRHGYARMSERTGAE